MQFDTYAMHPTDRNRDTSMWSVPMESRVPHPVAIPARFVKQYRIRALQ